MNNIPEQIHGRQITPHEQSEPIAHDTEFTPEQKNRKGRLLKRTGAAILLATVAVGVANKSDEIWDAVTPDFDFSHIGDDILKPNRPS